MEKTENKAYRFAELAILLYFIETTVDGTGRIIDFGFISIQMILFSLAFVASLYPLIKNFKAVMTNPCVIAILVFGLFAVISTCIGFKNGNQFKNIRADVTSVLGLALLPGMLATINRKEKLNRLINAVFVCISLVSVVMTLLYCFSSAIDEEAIKTANTFLGQKVSNISISGSHIYFRTHIFMIPGVLIGIVKAKEAKGNVRVGYSLLAGIMTFALIQSFERSTWLGFAIALAIMLILNPHDIGFYIKTGLCAVVAIATVICIASATRGELALIPDVLGRISGTEIGNSYSYDDYIEIIMEADERDTVSSNSTGEGIAPALAEDFSDPEVPASKKQIMPIIGSDNWRKILIQRHEYFIKKYLWTGAGYGFDMNLTEGGKTEYMYLDFLMKMGIFGFLSFLAAFFIPCFWGRKESYMTKGLISGYLGMAVASYFEPYLTNPMGIMVLCLLASSVTIEKERI